MKEPGSRRQKMTTDIAFKSLKFLVDRKGRRRNDQNKNYGYKQQFQKQHIMRPRCQYSIALQFFKLRYQRDRIITLKLFIENAKGSHVKVSGLASPFLYYTYFHDKYSDELSSLLLRLHEYKRFRFFLGFPILPTSLHGTSRLFLVLCY